MHVTFSEWRIAPMESERLQLQIRYMIWNCWGTIFRLFHSSASATAAVKATVVCLRFLYLSYLPHYRNVWHNCAVSLSDPIPIVCQISSSYRILAFSCLFIASWTAPGITAAHTGRKKIGVEREISVAGKEERVCCFFLNSHYCCRTVIFIQLSKWLLHHK